MTDVVERVGGDDHYVEIDSWGGCHFHAPDGEEFPLSFSPIIMEQVEAARKEVLQR